MTRISKQAERRHVSPRKRHYPSSIKTGPKRDNLNVGYKEHANAVQGDLASSIFIGKVV